MAILTIEQADRAGIGFPLECVALAQRLRRRKGEADAYVLDERKRIPEMPVTLVLETPDEPATEDAESLCLRGGGTGRARVGLIQVVGGWVVDLRHHDTGSYRFAAARWAERRVRKAGGYGAHFEAPGVYINVHTRRPYNGWRTSPDRHLWGFWASIGTMEGSPETWRSQPRADPLGWQFAGARDKAFVGLRGVFDGRMGGELVVEDRNYNGARLEATRGHVELVEGWVERMRERMGLDEDSAHDRIPRF